jgi:hypothetical protein
MQPATKQPSAVTRGRGISLAALMALFAAPWAGAQTTMTAPAPIAQPQGAGAAPTAPPPNRINRNPTFRAQLPADTPPPPPDPRDSSIRPVMPPGSSDSRDTVLPAPWTAAQPGAAASSPRTTP